MGAVGNIAAPILMAGRWLPAITLMAGRDLYYSQSHSWDQRKAHWHMNQSESFWMCNLSFHVLYRWHMCYCKQYTKTKPTQGSVQALSLWLSNVVAAGEIYFYDSFVIEITLGSIAHVVLLLCVQCFCVWHFLYYHPSYNLISWKVVTIWKIQIRQNDLKIL